MGLYYVYFGTIKNDEWEYINFSVWGEDVAYKAYHRTCTLVDLTNTLVALVSGETGEVIMESDWGFEN